MLYCICNVSSTSKNVRLVRAPEHENSFYVDPPPPPSSPLPSYPSSSPTPSPPPLSTSSSNTISAMITFPLTFVVGGDV